MRRVSVVDCGSADEGGCCGATFTREGGGADRERLEEEKLEEELLEEEELEEDEEELEEEELDDEVEEGGVGSVICSCWCC